jgi:hypothetical protein
MNILSDLTAVMDALNLSVETGVFRDKAPDEYVVITPLSDTFALYADNQPGIDIQEARISLFCKSNYLQRKKQITAALIAAELTITARLFIGREEDTGYFHAVIDTAKEYEWE